MQTANGYVTAQNEVEVFSKDLGVTVTAYTLPKVPPVLSLGKLCRENGFRFHWEPNELPYLQHVKSGKIVQCDLDQDTPIVLPAIEGEIQPEKTEEEPGMHLGGRRRTQVITPGNEAAESEEPSPTAVPPKKKRKKRGSKYRDNQPIPVGHNCFTHFPKDPGCPVCAKCKTQRSQHRVSKGPAPDSLPPPQAFADAITADHKILSEDGQGRKDDKTALIIYDRYTSWTQAYPAPTQSAGEVASCFQRFLGPQVHPKHVYTDGSRECARAMKDLGFAHDTSTPHHSESNGVAERTVRRVN